MTGDSLAEGTVEIVNRAGMHARPASELVKLAGSFESEILVEKTRHLFEPGSGTAERH